MKLKSKLFWILSVILFVSLGVAGYFFLNYSENAFRDAALQRLDAALNGFAGASETVNSKGIRMLTALHPVAGSD